MSIPISKVLISDNVDSKCEELLKAHGIEVVAKYNLSPSDLIKELETCNGLIVRSDTKVTGEIIEATKNLKVIGRAGTGVDNIDLNAATRKGIIVLNAPNGNSISACELTCSFITSLARYYVFQKSDLGCEVFKEKQKVQVLQAPDTINAFQSCVPSNVPSGCDSMKQGKWDRKAFAGGSELLGKTLAIIGLGKIGKEVAKRMKSFDMQIVGYDPFVTSEEADLYSIKRLDLDNIWPIADYITVHTPLIPQTRNLINKSVFAKCKAGVRIINAARGGIVNEEDLLEALESGKCAGAALDVYSEEPPVSPKLKTLICHPKVIVTPHIGASTKEAQIRVAVEVAEQFVSLNDTTSKFKVTGVLNAPALLASRQSQNAAWIDLAELLGRVVSRIAKGQPLKGANIVISLAGPEIQNMKFLNTSVLLGVLSGTVQNGYNLINSPLYAEETGLKSVFDDKEKMNLVNSVIRNILKISIYINNVCFTTAQGTVIDDIPYLLQINDAVFQPATVRLTKNSPIFSCELSHLPSAIQWIMTAYKNISNMAIAYGKQNWIVLSAEANNSTAPANPHISSY